jgi:parallel beta-helix repeat protein
MASPFLTALRAGLGALVVALAPQAGSADLSEANLPDLRAALRAIEADLGTDINSPVDVSAIWAKLPKQDTAEPAVEAETPTALPAAKGLFGDVDTSVPTQNAARAVLTPAVDTPVSQTSGGGLFAMQLSQTTAAQPLIAPLPAPTFENSGSLQASAVPITSSASASARVTPQDVVVSNFRLMLASLSQTYTGRNAMAVVNAQGPRGAVALSVRSGTVTLADLHTYAAASGIAQRADGALSIPIVIWPEATLRLSAGEHLSLARDAGAFVLSMGALDINGATIEGVGPKNPHTPSFGQTAKFSGLSVAGNLLTQNKGKVVIRNSLFDEIKRVSVAGTTRAEISGNTFTNPTDTTLHLINAANAVIENNLFFHGSHTNALRLEAGSINAKISKNIFLSGQRVAMVISGRSDHAQVRDNIVWKRQGAGVKLLQTRCALVQNNVILDNLQKGVEVRKSDGTVVSGNLIAGNRNAGIWVSSQGREAQTSLDANVLVANGSGLSAATGAEIFLTGNNFAQQLPKLLDGDISRLSRELVVDLKGETPLRFNGGSAEQQQTSTALCGSLS